MEQEVKALLAKEAIVLEGLSGVLFEPLDSVSEKFLTFKTVFLLAISYLK